MLDVRIIMNSVMEEILAFKCCNIPNQNFEMHVDNRGDHPVTVPGKLLLENETGAADWYYLFPPWTQTIQPGEGAAFYCTMDERMWRRYRALTIFDGEGNAYRFDAQQVTEGS